MENKLTQKLVRKLFKYDDGNLFWKIIKGKRTIDIVGTNNGKGYLRVWIGKKQYYIHRIIWLYHYGYNTENHIDHIDQNKLNNRIENLREVSQQCNMRNSKLACNNTSGIKGVNFHANKWRAKIAVNKKHYYLGIFNDFDDAVCARLAAEQCLNWEGCDSNSPTYKYVQEICGR